MGRILLRAAATAGGAGWSVNRGTAAWRGIVTRWMDRAGRGTRLALCRADRYNAAMPFRSLGQLLDAFEKDGQLARVEVPLSADLEVAEITRRIARREGPALLFSRVGEGQVPLVTNLYGSRQRLCRALGLDRLEQLGRPPNGEAAAGWMGKLGALLSGEHSARLAPKTVGKAACQQIVHLGSDVDLHSLPIPRSWPDESEPTLTAGLVICGSAQSDRCDVRRYDLCVLDARRLAICPGPHEPLSKFLDEHAARAQKLPVAVSLGGDPVLALVGQIPAVDVLAGDPWTFAAALRDLPLELAQCRTSELMVPSGAEIVLEGHLDPAEEPIAAPGFAGSSGYYSGAAQARVLHVDALTRQTSPVLPVLVGGAGSGELEVIHFALSRMFLPRLQAVAPELADVALPAAGGGFGLVFAAIRKSYPQQAQRVAAALWGTDVLMYAKMIVVVDEGIDVHSALAVWQRVGDNLHAPRDVATFTGPGMASDHAAPEPAIGGKLLIDATAKLAGEHPRAWPGELKPAESTEQLVSRRWAEYGL